MRYLNCLFKYRNSAARITLYDALVQSLLDYCPSVTWTFLIGPVKEIEKCARRFLRTIRLGYSSKWTDDERYEQNTREIGWSSQTVRRVKLSLKFVFKLVNNHVPFGHNLFQEYDDPLQSEDAISTRSLARLLLPHSTQRYLLQGTQSSNRTALLRGCCMQVVVRARSTC